MSRLFLSLGEGVRWIGDEFLVIDTVMISFGNDMFRWRVVENDEYTLV